MYVFSDSKGQHLKYEFIRDSFSQLQRDIGIRKIRLHDLRHTFASHFVMNGGSLYDLQKLMGHGSSEITMKYSHLSQNHLVNQASKVSFKTAKFEDLDSNNLDLRIETNRPKLTLVK